MTLGQRVRFLFGGSKESQARLVTTMQQIGRPVSTPANYEQFAKTGYGRSAMIYRCVSMIAGAARGLEWVMYKKNRDGTKTELSDHPILSLWDKPNPLQSRADLVENLVAFYCLDGNSYLEANSGALAGTIPLELWNVRPDKMKVVGGQKGYPAAYEFSYGGITRVWPVDIVNMKSQILHWKSFHPLNDWYGQSAIEAALIALDQNLAGQKWNLALLQNSATPSGVLQVKVTDSNPRGEITDEQYKRMRADFEQNYQGVKNTGKPMIIEGGLSWAQMSIGPKDMEYAKGKEMTALDICMVFGVPGELVGLGQKTFTNYREARLAFYEETVLPIMDGAVGAINRWLAPAMGDGVCLAYDKDEIEILQWKRDQKYISLANVNYLTQNEKREAVGYEEQEGWDVFVIGQKVGATPEDFAAPEPVPPIDPNADPNADPLNPDDPTKPKPDDKKPPKKDPPPPDEGNDENADGKGWKSLNLVNKNEKRQSWRAQNARRKRLMNAFNRDLLADYDELVSHLVKVKGHPNDARLTEFSLLNVVSDFMPTMERTIKRHIKYTLHDFGGAILDHAKALNIGMGAKSNLKYDHYVNSYTERRSGESIKTITSTTQKQIRRIVGEWVQTAITDGDTNADLSKFIEADFEELTPAQAMRIARTETGMASNNGAIEAVKSLQVPGMTKEWVSAEDGRVRDGGPDGNHADHTAVDGTVVELDEKFTVPPDCSMDGPGDPSAPADQIINCRCVLTFQNRGDQ